MDGKKTMEKGMGRRKEEKETGTELALGFCRVFPSGRITAGTVTVREAVHSEIVW